MNLEELAMNDPDALHALIVDPATNRGVLYCAASCLGQRWTPDRWWPTLLVMLRSDRAIMREVAMNAVEGRDVYGGRPVGFSVRDWPVDITAHRDEMIAELQRIAADSTTECLQESAAELAEDLRTNTRSWDREEAAAPSPQTTAPASSTLTR